MATHPLGGNGTISATPESHMARKHKGWQSDNAVDLRVKAGTPVYAVEDGVIGPRFGKFPSKDPTLEGSRLTLMTSSGNAYYYAHLSELAPGIDRHKPVKEGDLLGWTGTANGVDHLHFGVKDGDPVALMGELQPLTCIEFTDQDVALHPDAHMISLPTSDDASSQEQSSGTSPDLLDAGDQLGADPEGDGGYLQDLWDDGSVDSAPEMDDGRIKWPSTLPDAGGQFQDYWDQGSLPDSSSAVDGQDFVAPIAHDGGSPAPSLDVDAGQLAAIASELSADDGGLLGLLGFGPSTDDGDGLVAPLWGDGGVQVGYGDLNSAYDLADASWDNFDSFSGLDDLDSGWSSLGPDSTFGVPGSHLGSFDSGGAFGYSGC